MVGQRFELDEVLRILLGVLLDVAKGLVEGCGSFVDRYNIINVSKGSLSDNCFRRRSVGSVRHVCLRGLAVVMVKEDRPARAYGRLSYIENTKDVHDSNGEAR